MPIFEFKCVKCGEEIEVIQKFDDPPPEHCGEKMERVLSGGRIGLDFRGTGWYKIDYGNKGKSDGKGKKSS